MTVSAYTKPAHSPNEDNFLIDENLKLFAIFDGVGGYAGGSIAAKIAARIIWESVKDETYKDKKLETATLLKNALITAAEKISEDGERNNRPDQGTTATIALITNRELTIANVGDSRCYGLTKSQELKRLTKDHSILEELVKDDKLSLAIAQKIDQATNSEELNSEELSIFVQRNIITAALSFGFKKSDIYFNEIGLSEFKMLILTTDGVHDNLTDEEIKILLLKSKSPKNAAKKLVEKAFKISTQNTLRSKPDDITAVVVTL
jgi:protein phosphatase